MINEELLDILEKLQVGDKPLVNAHDEVLDLFLVMLSEAKQKARNHKALKYDNNIYDKEITNAYEEALFIMEKTIERKIHSA